MCEDIANDYLQRPASDYTTSCRDRQTAGRAYGRGTLQESAYSVTVVSTGPTDDAYNIVHLELADGSKICSTQKIPGVLCSVGKISSYEDFTVTKLLHGVDVVLGMTWLQRWNPLIDWVQQVMYIKTQYGWDRIRGLFLKKEHQIGTVKLLSDEDLASLALAPDIEILRTPQFWTYAVGASSWTNVPNRGARVEDTQNFYSSGSPGAHSFNSSSPAPKRTVQYARVAGTVQHKTSSKAAGQRQLLSPK